MILAHKIALDPTPAQAVYFARASGVARFAWNWALARWQQEYALWTEYWVRTEAIRSIPAA